MFPNPCRSQWQRTSRRRVGTSFIGCISRRGTHGQTDGIPLIGGSRIGRTDVYDHPWILSAADYTLPHRGKCRSGCGNDGRRRSRSEPQDVATAVAPKSPGGAAGGRSTRRAVGDRRGAGSKADRATGQVAELVGPHAHRKRSCHRNISTNSASRSLRFENGMQEHRVLVFKNLQRKSTSLGSRRLPPSTPLAIALTPAFDSCGVMRIHSRFRQ